VTAPASDHAVQAAAWRRTWERLLRPRDDMDDDPGEESRDERADDAGDAVAAAPGA
jgi:hypothetical protein